MFSKLKKVIKNTADMAASAALNSTLNDYKSPSGGYMNYAVFSVMVINPKTGRNNKRKYECKTESEARSLAAADGYHDIISVTPIPFEPPTERQLAACREYHRTIPPGACMKDVTFLMTKEIENEDKPSVELIRKADRLGLKFSYLAGAETLQEMIDNNK
ncbi:MAG: hypothetical protein IKI33_02520 [Eubacterium sp.]|nr:hypothetical protein [Eubacterium sp.]